MRVLCNSDPSEEFFIQEKYKSGFEKCLSFGERIDYLRDVLIINYDFSDEFQNEKKISVFVPINVSDGTIGGNTVRSVQRQILNELLFDLNSKGKSHTNTYAKTTDHTAFIYGEIGYHICDLDQTLTDFINKFKTNSDKPSFIETHKRIINDFLHRCEKDVECYKNVFTGFNLAKIGNEISVTGDFYKYFLQRCGKNLAEFEKYLIELSGGSGPAGKKVLKGFYSTLSTEQIKSLFDQLKPDYIDNRTAERHFNAIFKNELLPHDFIPVKRLKKLTVVLLAYLISELFQKENQVDYWSIAENCFDAKNLRQSFNNAYQYNPNHKPRGYKGIDIILKNIYTPLQ